ncbi:hypothetical protein BJ165DRAFT_1523726 [Panaeolus papilionaceus]|nr:hypothetical protein BJ165DRAFT_1523726 [Panaeolus papilionaceus]
METRFWPQQFFLNLNVKAVIIQAKTNNTSFWGAVPELLDKISTSLEGLDVSYALDYDFFTCTQNIIFPKLRTLVLKIKHRLAPGIRAAKQTDGETALQNLLSQIKIPAISTIFIIIADAHEYILPRNGEPQWKWYESLQRNIIDNALCDLTNTPHDIPGTWRLPSSHTRSQQPFHSRLSRVVIGAWYYDWSMSSVSTEDAILYLEEHLPQCVKHGVKICSKVVEDDLELLGV